MTIKIALVLAGGTVLGTIISGIMNFVATKISHHYENKKRDRDRKIECLSKIAVAIGEEPSQSFFDGLNEARVIFADSTDSMNAWQKYLNNPKQTSQYFPPLFRALMRSAGLDHSALADHQLRAGFTPRINSARE